MAIIQMDNWICNFLFQLNYSRKLKGKAKHKIPHLGAPAVFLRH